MKTLILAAALAAFSGPAALAQPAPENFDLKAYYDKAFSYYVAGEYSKAIEQWNMVLRSDPKQTTAKNMIEEARRKMAGSASDLKGAFARLVQRAQYADALQKLEELLATDPTNPYYVSAQGRLRTISAIAPRRPSASRAWGAAADGIGAWLGEKADLPFAYDALRYAAELAPAERAFPRLVAALEAEAPQLRLNDTKPENVAVLEHKKEKALHHIYDSKFYLAVKELEGVLRLEPDDVTALKRAGSAYLQLKDYRQARSSWQRALELSPGDEQLPEYLKALDEAMPEAARPGPSKTRKGARKQAGARY
ncbi:MAG: tetratricopeptide repeat protein [Elusimicrobiales bacterium]